MLALSDAAAVAQLGGCLDHVALPACTGGVALTICKRFTGLRVVDAALPLKHTPLKHTPHTIQHAGLRVVAVARRRERLESLQQHMLSPAVGLAAVDFLPGG